MFTDREQHRCHNSTNDNIIPLKAPIRQDERDGLRQAQQLVDDFDIELWDGPRFIARLKSRHEPLKEQKASNDPIVTSYKPAWSRPSIPREPQTTKQVWVILGCLTVLIMGSATIIDLVLKL